MIWCVEQSIQTYQSSQLMSRSFSTVGPNSTACVRLPWWGQPIYRACNRVMQALHKRCRTTAQKRGKACEHATPEPQGDCSSTARTQRSRSRRSELIVCPMQCMDRIKIYLCVFVCVCVSVRRTFCQLAYRSYHSKNFYSSLTDADLRNDVLLGASVMTNHIQGSNVPQNPHFGGLNRHFKPNMRKIQIAISSDLCIRLT